MSFDSDVRGCGRMAELGESPEEFGNIKLVSLMAHLDKSKLRMRDGHGMKTNIGAILEMAEVRWWMMS
jgi:hypothetical protein